MENEGASVEGSFGRRGLFVGKASISSSKLIEEAVAIEVEEEFNPKFDKRPLNAPEND
jgi:hypothetical protein